MAVQEGAAAGSAHTAEEERAAVARLDDGAVLEEASIPHGHGKSQVTTTRAVKL